MGKYFLRKYFVVILKKGFSNKKLSFLIQAINGGKSLNIKEDKIEKYCSKLDAANDYSEIWKIVKSTVKDALGEQRSSMMLFLDDLSLSLGAYYPVGTNNIVLNRRLLEIVKATIKSKQKINAFTYSLLTHEYLHSIGHLREEEVRKLVCKVSEECFGETHITTELAKKSPWMLLNKNLINNISSQKAPIEVVKDFEKNSQNYIV